MTIRQKRDRLAIDESAIAGQAPDRPRDPRHVGEVCRFHRPFFNVGWVRDTRGCAEGHFRPTRAPAVMWSDAHGLATALCGEPGAVEEIERLAQAIVVEAGRPDLIDYARQVAEAEIDLRRV